MLHQPQTFKNFRLEMAEKQSRGVTLNVPGVQFGMPDGPDRSDDDEEVMGRLRSTSSRMRSR